MKRGPYAFSGFVAREDMIDHLADYVNHGVPLGDFLRSVVSNDLSGAVGRADEDNMRNLPALVAWVYNEAPRECWGSPERYEAWLLHFELQRRREANDEGN